MKNLDEELLYYSYVPSLSLSLFGCLFVIILYMFAHSLRGYPFTLVFWLNLSDFIRTLALFAVIVESYFLNFCEIFGFILNFGTITSYFWTFTIAFTIYQDVIQEKQNLRKYFKYWFFINNFTGTILSIIPIINYNYDSVYNLCLVDNTRFGEIYFFIIMLFLYILILSVTTLLYVSIYCKYSQKINISEENRFSVKKLFAFPLILAVSTMPTNLNIILKLFGINYMALNIIAAVLWSLHGFFDFLAYSFTIHVRNYLKSIFFKKKPSYQLIDFN